MKRWFLVLMLFLTASGGIVTAGPEEGERDWFGGPPPCC